MQKLLEAAKEGKLAGPVQARLQGPFDGHNMSTAEMTNINSMLVVAGGIGLPAVLPALQRLALYREQSDTPGVKGSMLPTTTALLL